MISPMTDYIYKISPADVWAEAEAKGAFEGAGIDLADGFIHFSTASQVAETAWLHFHKVEGLVLVQVSVEGLELVWEESRGGAMFPHLYTPLQMSQVSAVTPMMVGDDGEHIFPEEIPKKLNNF